MSRALLHGALVTVAGVALALAVAGGGSEGTVVGKVPRGFYDHACAAGGTPTGPVAVRVWGACSVPCWRLLVRDGDGDTTEPCVSREEYDRTQPGAFRHGRTDR